MKLLLIIFVKHWRAAWDLIEKIQEPGLVAECHRARFWLNITHSCDDARLSVVANTTTESAEVTARVLLDEETPWIRSGLIDINGFGFTTGGNHDRGVRTIVMLLGGACIRQWLQVSLLMDDWEHVFGSLRLAIPLIYSIGAGFLATALGLWGEYRHIRHLLSRPGGAARAYLNRTVAVAGGITFVALVNFVRVVGVVACPSHLFNVLGGCAD